MIFQKNFVVKVYQIGQQFLHLQLQVMVFLIHYKNHLLMFQQLMVFQHVKIVLNLIGHHIIIQKHVVQHLKIYIQMLMVFLIHGLIFGLKLLKNLIHVHQFLVLNLLMNHGLVIQYQILNY